MESTINRVISKPPMVQEHESQDFVVILQQIWVGIDHLASF